MNPTSDSQKNPFASGAVSVFRFGAKGDGRTLDTGAIQAAVDAAHEGGGGTVVVPSGAFVTGSIFLKDNVTLFLDPGAVLLASRDPRDFPVVRGRWEGLTREIRAAIIYAAGAKRIAVVGRGTIDGRGEEWWGRYRRKELDYPRPRTVQLEDCENVLLEGFSVRDSPSWTINPVRSRGVVVRGLDIRNHPDSPTTDGVNPDSCEAVRIADCFISVGDDCVTLKSGVEAEPAELRPPCRDIAIVNCVMERGHGGVVLGSETSGGVSDVVISNCVFKGTDRGIRMKSRRGRGGTIERVRVSNIVMRDVLCPFTMNLRYHCGGAQGNALVADRGAAPVGPGTPAIRNVSFSSITAVGARLAAAWLDGLPESPIQDVSFSDVSVSMDGDDAPAPAEMADGIPALSRAGFHATDVTGLGLHDVRVAGARGESFVLDGSVSLRP